jgi:hypothetical protein
MGAAGRESGGLVCIHEAHDPLIYRLYCTVARGERRRFERHDSVGGGADLPGARRQLGLGVAQLVLLLNKQAPKRHAGRPPQLSLEVARLQTQRVRFRQYLRQAVRDLVWTLGVGRDLHDGTSGNSTVGLFA